MAYREAVRDVIRNCIYAVDKNPLAVDLCKVALWIEGHSAGLPLSFLDHHVKCGDSLVGVADLKMLARGIPDDAYKPVTGDDKQTASSYKKRNQEERTGQLAMPLGETAAEAPKALAGDFGAFAALEERTPDEVRAKEDLYHSLRDQRSDWWKLKVACDLWAAAFFTPLKPTDGGQPDLVPTTTAVHNAIAGRAVQQALKGAAIGLSQDYRFFHWPLEFPEVFAAEGFDVVLGNPPWERIKLQEQEFFAARDREIADAPTKAAREGLIKGLPATNPALAREFAQERHAHEAASRFVRASGRFPLTAVGDINTYALFAELDHVLHNEGGRTGFVVPTGIATDDTCKRFFADVNMHRTLVSLYDFENREGLFLASHRSYKFSLVTLAGVARPATTGAEFAFFLHRPDQLREHERRFTLTAEDFALLNPNTRTSPVFRSRRDAEITKAIYRRVPALVREAPPEENPWAVSFLRMFDMTNDSQLFRRREQLEAAGFRLRGNVFVRNEEEYLPLFEAKAIDAYNQRAASVLPSGGMIRRAQAVESTVEQMIDPSYLPLPLYWVSRTDFERKASLPPELRWLLGFKDVTSPTNHRTVICSALPRSPMGNKIPVVISQAAPALRCCLLASLNSIALDYVARTKVGGVSLNFFLVKQFPLLPPSAYGARSAWLSDEPAMEWISRRVLELTYTAWDLRPFAQDLGCSGPPFRWDEERRFLLRCEVDAAFFHLYGIEREDVDYIMDTFPIVKRKDEQRYGEYRTKLVILEIYDEMARAVASGQPYRTRLDPPPADPRVAHTTTARESV